VLFFEGEVLKLHTKITPTWWCPMVPIS